jgi:hypothetical protein
VALFPKRTVKLFQDKGFHCAPPRENLEQDIGREGIKQISEINIELHFYLVGNLAYRDKIEKLSNENPNILIHNPISFEEIHSSLIHYDLG